MTDSVAVVAAHEKARQDIRNALIECAVLATDRNNRIRTAAALGIARTEIAALVGLSRAHVHAILKAGA